ncbi:hypothetical protein F7R23_31430 [Burkholderia diffusa]|nr:hypothetical protein F7R23_31430 [Burkholderia diffusa]
MTYRNESAWIQPAAPAAAPRTTQARSTAEYRALDAIGIKRDEFDGAGTEVDSEQAHDGLAYSSERISMIAGSRHAARLARRF